MLTITAIKKNLVNLLYPLHCACCKKSLDPLDEFGICGFCIKKIQRNPKPYCRLCGRSMEDAKELCAECRKIKPYFNKAYSACLYEGVLKEIIHLFKYRGKISLERMLSKLMADFIRENSNILAETDTITFVPMQNRRMRSRGFNQSKILAFNISKIFEVPLSDLLEKVRSTANQNELSRDGRLVNLKGAFRTKEGIVLNGLKILLIDDVMTTGATLSECARMLLHAGAGRVTCLTLARGV